MRLKKFQKKLKYLKRNLNKRNQIFQKKIVKNQLQHIFKKLKLKIKSKKKIKKFKKKYFFWITYKKGKKMKKKTKQKFKKIIKS